MIRVGSLHRLIVLDLFYKLESCFLGCRSVFPKVSKFAGFFVFVILVIASRNKFIQNVISLFWNQNVHALADALLLLLLISFMSEGSLLKSFLHNCQFRRRNLLRLTCYNADYCFEHIILFLDLRTVFLVRDIILEILVVVLFQLLLLLRCYFLLYCICIFLIILVCCNNFLLNVWGDLHILVAACQSQPIKLSC